MSGPFGSTPHNLFNTTDTSFYDYLINQSLRFEDGKLTKTITSAGDGKTFTVSMWIKRAKTGVNHELIAAGHGNDGVFAWRIRSDDTMQFATRWVNTNGANFQIARRSTRVFRDVGAWYHCVLAVDTTVSGASSKFDYFKIYVNGEDITSDFTTVTNTEESVAATYNDTTRWNQANNKDQSVGYSQAFTTNYFAGYIAEVHSISGTKLTADSFGETKEGIWLPKAYTGSYGTGGFHFDFANGSDLGNDASSGGSNDYTPSGLAAHDVVLDSPTNNFCVYNPLDANTSTLSEGNLKVASASTTSNPNTRGTFAVLSGKWYWEVVTLDSSSSSRIHSWAGLASTERATNSLAKIVVATGNGVIYGNSQSLQSGLTAWSQNDVIGVALDVDNTSVQFYRNGSTHGSAVDYSSFIPATEFLTPFIMDGASNIVCTTVSNFGQDSSFANNKTSGSADSADGNGIGDFYYAPPSGFLALASSNLPDPEIDPNGISPQNPTDHFNTVLYTGDGASSKSVTGVGFNPDWVWFKNRASAYDHALMDSVRGASAAYLSSNNTASESTYGNLYGDFTSFNSDGFTVAEGTDGTYPDAAFNQSSEAYVAWNWLAGTAFSNDASATSVGTIDTDSGSQINTTAGLGILKYTGTGSAGTIAHGLNSAPEMLIVKNRDTARDWLVYHSALGASKRIYLCYLLAQDSGTAASATWNDTAPTSTVFSIGNNIHVNESGDNYIVYCFHSVEGYSKIGSYVGNGNADGTFVHTGFRPAWIMIKNASGTGGWEIHDNKRVGYNPADETLDANTAAAEATGNNLDILSNGFKVRHTYGTANTSGSTYIYLAFAAQPFKYANAR